jgi:hypothetical protein
MICKAEKVSEMLGAALEAQGMKFAVAKLN